MCSTLIAALTAINLQPYFVVKYAWRGLDKRLEKPLFSTF